MRSPFHTRFRICALLMAIVFVVAGTPGRADLIDLEDLALEPESFKNGADFVGGFISGGAFFNNRYDPTFDVWSGWAYSNRTDVTTPGFLNQYSAFHLPSGGGDFSPNYAVAFNFDVSDAFVVLPGGLAPQAVSITNTTYAALSMLEGDQFAKKFGGADGTDPDYFLLTIYGISNRFEVTGAVEFYLADFRADDSSFDYIVSNWTRVDLTPLGDAFLLVFQLTSSDVGDFGMNTPAFFALDNLEVGTVKHMPEPTTFGLAALGALGLLAFYVRRRRVAKAT
jgi:hypothetical protein